MALICAGIVTFNPDLLRLKENIDSICKQVKKIYIIDNGSFNARNIALLCSAYPKAKLIENSENLGIAKALNQMCDYAQLDRFEWILTLDQDTVSPSGMIKKMSQYLSNEGLGIICPAVYYEGLDKTTASKEETTYVKACMTSASLTRIDAWKKVGGFREDFFIDFVDNEFCMKLKIHGYKIMRVNSCVISHQLGQLRKKKLFWIFNVCYACHSPLRFYYMVRNNDAFIREYGQYLCVCKERIKLLYIIASNTLLSDKKKEMIEMAYCGYMHSKKRKFGRFSKVE